ncbi:hypothetical protein ACWEJ6_12145 [Nonomuraea sp. NPDC004702]
MIHALVSLLVAAPLAAGGATSVQAESQSSACPGGHAFANLDNRYDTINDRGIDKVGIRIGLSVDCSAVFYLKEGAQVDLWCYAHGQYILDGPTWTYIRYNNGSGDKYGWVNDGYLHGYGSNQYCPY